MPNSGFKNSQQKLCLEEEAQALEEEEGQEPGIEQEEQVQKGEEQHEPGGTRESMWGEAGEEGTEGKEGLPAPALHYPGQTLIPGRT